MNLAQVMDEVAAALGTIDGLRVHAYPATSVTPPAAVVLMPRRYTYDETYGRGSDRITLPVAVMAGRATERGARDALAGYLAGGGPGSVKAAIEQFPGRSYDSVRVVDVDIDVFTEAGVDYWGAVFELDIYGTGE